MKVKHMVLSLFIVLTILIYIHISVGIHFFSFREIGEALFQKEGAYFHIIRTIRLPRTLLVILAGSALAVAGYLSQLLTKNPIATPQILGINALVVLVAILVQLCIPFAVLFLPLFAILAVFALSMGIAFLHFQSNQNITHISLIGTAFNLLFISLTQMLMFINEDYQEQFFFWLVGGVNHATWITTISLLPYIVLGIGIPLFYRHSIDMLKFDEDTIKSLGVSLRKTQLITILAITLLVVGVVSLCGPIGFVGLVVPHFVRRLSQTSVVANIFLNMLCGAIFLLLADIIAKLLFYPQEVYIGVISAIIGSITFFIILFQMEEK